jgi:hypothetical protein
MKLSQNLLFTADTSARSVAESGFLGLVHQFGWKIDSVYCYAGNQAVAITADITQGVRIGS